MQTEDVLARLQPWRTRHQRPAWRPRVVDNENALTASKFGGTPWLAPAEDWPICRGCDRPMPLLVQLDLAQLPPTLEQCFGAGLLQLFYCTECDGGWEPFAESQLVRVVHPAGTTPTVGVPEGVESFPPRTMVGWSEIIDLPDPSEHEELGVRYTYDFTANTVRLDCPELGLTVEQPIGEDLAEAVSTAAAGDKLAGWPAWVQGVEYPSCPECGQRMRLVFQLDSEDHLPFMFGDLGTGHLTQCPAHLAVVAFGWACS